MTIIGNIKRFMYDWARPIMSDAVNGNEKACGDDYDNYHRFFNRGNTTWKGEQETIECLKKIMKKVEKYVYLVVVGYIQSGKSSLMIYYSTWMAKEHDMNVVIMLRNQTVDIDSLETKFRNFKKEKKMTNQDIEIIPFVKKIKTKDFLKKFRETKKIFIILGNSEQLSKVNEIIKYGNDNHTPIKPFVLCIDELDLNEKQEETKFFKEFDELKCSGFIVQILGVTGTALPVVFKRVEQLENEQIIRLDAPLIYKGIQNITFTDIDINDQYIVKNTMLNMLKSNFAFYGKDSKRHPVILLIKDERVKTNQIDMKDKLIFEAKIQKNWAIIVWNGDGMYIKMPKKQELFVKRININEALQNMKDGIYGPPAKYIGIIAGDLANRGQSFVSTDYNWHLTHQIMCARTSSTGTNLMQYTRLCGCYNDDIPLELFTSLEIQKELFAYDYLQEAIVEKCEEIIEKELLKDILTKMKLKPECVVRRHIDTKLKLKYQQLSNYDKTMCGEKLDVNTLKEAIEYVKNEFHENVKVYVKENIQRMLYNENNIQNVKKKLKEKGFKKMNVVKLDMHKTLYKNPEYVTSTRQNAEVMIGNKNGFMALYVKNKNKPNRGELFIFQTPQGIYLARSTGNKEELAEMFKDKYQLTF